MSDVARDSCASAVAADPARRPRRTVLVLLGATATLALAAVTASAYWSGSGTGSGSAPSGSTSAVSLSPGVPAGGLIPGGQADVVLSVSNPNRSPVFIGSLVLDPTQGSGGFGVDAGHSGCLVSALSYTTQTNSGAGWTVPAKSGTVNGTLSITVGNALAMSLSAANACQGATATVYLVTAP